MHYYLSSWVGTGVAGDEYRPTVGGAADAEGIAWWALDLRPDAARPEGRCLLATMARPAKEEPGTRYLGQDPDEALSSTILSRVGNDLSVTLGASHVTGVGVELMLPPDQGGHARTDGSRWRPLRPLSRGTNAWELWLGGLLWSVPRIAGGAVHAESFDKVDGALGPDLTWANVDGSNWEIVSNRAGPEGAIRGITAYARAEHDAATADQYAEFLVSELTADANNQCGPCVRFAAAANTSYMAMVDGDATVTLRKTVSGSRSNLSSAVGVTISGLPKVLRSEIDGSTLTGFWAGSQVVQVTDSSIVGNLRGGLYGSETASGTIYVDSFEFGDLGAGGGVARDLAGTGSAAALATGAASVARPLTAAAPAASGASGALAASRAISGSAVAASAASGDLAVARAVAGMAPAASGATGALLTAGDADLAGAVIGASSASGLLAVDRPFVGVSAAAGGAAGAIALARPLTATAAAAAGFTGTLTALRPLTGSMAAANGATGLLSSTADGDFVCQLLGGDAEAISYGGTAAASAYGGTTTAVAYGGNTEQVSYGGTAALCGSE